jgi:nucleoside-diphosphate kinase
MSRSVTDARLAFHADHTDPHSGIDMKFLVLFFEDNTVELIDETSKKTVLKRSICPSLTRDQFFLGSKVVVFGRVMHLMRYGDTVTEQLCERTSEATVVAFSEEVFGRLGDILDVMMLECSFGVSELVTICYTSAAMRAAYPGDAQMEAAAQLLPASFEGKRVVLCRIIRDGAVARAAGLADRLRLQRSVVWIAGSKAEADASLPLFCLSPQPALAAGPSSVVVIKPHVLRERRAGEALQILLNTPGIALQAITQTAVSSAEADSFLQAYKGVIKDYRPMVEQMFGGALWAVQVTGTEDPVITVRAACGPYDPVIAKVLRPESLRARIGADVARNGVYCTDFAEDASNDASFLFLGQRS